MALQFAPNPRLVDSTKPEATTTAAVVESTKPPSRAGDRHRGSAITVRLSAEVAAKLDQYCATGKISRSEAIKQFVMRSLES